MLLYSLLHLAGVAKTDESGNRTAEPAISLDDIRNFRQLHSPCAGHPEYGYAAGIETTTGPLGQGLGQQRRHGDRGQMAGGNVRPSKF